MTDIKKDDIIRNVNNVEYTFERTFDTLFEVKIPDLAEIYILRRKDDNASFTLERFSCTVDIEKISTLCKPSLRKMLVVSDHEIGFLRPLISRPNVPTFVENTENKIQLFKGKYRFLSNGYNSDVCINGVTFRNVEAAYQAQKVDSKDRAMFSNLDAGAAYIFGKALKQIPDDWKERRLSIMEQIVREKFNQNVELARDLIDTGNAEIVYRSKVNRFYGYWDDGKGENHLGRILMEIRQNLKEQGWFLRV